MYKFNHNRQYSLDDFDQPIGLNMDPNNRWVKKAATIPLDDIEERYAGLFTSTTGMPAKPLRTTLGSLIIQRQLNFSDRELVEEIAENPYSQYFIGLPGYKVGHPFAPSLMLEFRKRLNDDVLAEINEMIIEYNRPDDLNGGDSPDGGGTDEDGSSDDASASENKGILILDTTCAPSNIKYPQDIVFFAS